MMTMKWVNDLGSSSSSSSSYRHRRHRPPRFAHRRRRAPNWPRPPRSAACASGTCGCPARARTCRRTPSPWSDPPTPSSSSSSRVRLTARGPLSHAAGPGAAGPRSSAHHHYHHRLGGGLPPQCRFRGCRRLADPRGPLRCWPAPLCRSTNDVGASSCARGSHHHHHHWRGCGCGCGYGYGALACRRADRGHRCPSCRASFGAAAATASGPLCRRGRRRQRGCGPACG